MNTAILVILVSAVAPLCQASEKPISPALQVPVIDTLGPSLVAVEYTLRYDKGNEPIFGRVERCPKCGRTHILSQGGILVMEERPLEVAGFLVSARRVITTDLAIETRFIGKIDVGLHNRSVGAKIIGYYSGQNALLLEIDEPISGSIPLTFDAAAAAPYFIVDHAKTDGSWKTTMKSLPMTVSMTDRGRRFVAVPETGVIVDEKGTPAALSMKDELPVGDSWKRSPLDWPMISVEEMADLLVELKKWGERGVLRVSLEFRSPREDDTSGSAWGYGYDDDAALRNVLGVLVDSDRILVISNLKPNVTARLEKIVVHPADGEPVSASFAGTLRDFGCFLATLETPLQPSPNISRADIRETRNRLLLSAEIALQGERRVTYLGHRRVAAYAARWQGRIYPQIPGKSENVFLFDPNGDLLAAPVAIREKVTFERRRRDQETTVVTPLPYILSGLERDGRGLDPGNAPRSSERENRVAWLGVVLQGLDRELARANGVSDLTNDGRMGALVSYVYPGSPAEAAGIGQGSILLRLHAEGLPKPIDVSNDQWEPYYDNDWPPVLNEFSRILTDLGFGKQIRIEMFRDDKRAYIDHVITESPPHFESAPRYKSEALGLTVRDLTYEVRRHFQAGPDDPGVIVSKIEPGSKAAVASIEEQEIISHVNNVPIENVGEFEKLIDQVGDLKLMIRQMTQRRLVRIKHTDRIVDPVETGAAED
ncbi:MAG: PDZ domain-containing protein [Planctomycetota bacterium]|nr:PDZ domain-containing protein [Planctomycetota bacterium]